jgi:hypothetical protein
MATYLIDYENVHKSGLAGINNLFESDSVIVFVGNKTNDVPIETVIAMLNTPAQVKIKKMKKTADNYLDFQLATCLGGLVVSGGDREFFIISNDRDFDAVVDYWKHNKASVKIACRKAISPAVTAESATAPATAPAKLDNAMKKTIRGLVKNEGLSPGSYTGIYNLFLNENEKHKFHSGLVRLFKQEQGKRIYDLLKDAFDQYTA